MSATGSTAMTFEVHATYGTPSSAYAWEIGDPSQSFGYDATGLYSISMDTAGFSKPNNKMEFNIGKIDYSMSAWNDPRNGIWYSYVSPYMHLDGTLVTISNLSNFPIDFGFSTTSKAYTSVGTGISNFYRTFVVDYEDDLYNDLSFSSGGTIRTDYSRKRSYAFTLEPGAVAKIRANLHMNVYVVGRVPEPETWSMLLSGFIFTGIALRRKRGLRFSTSGV